MRGDVLFSVFVQTRRAGVTGAARRGRESDYMPVDQILRTHLRERQVSQMVGNQLANAYVDISVAGDRLGQRSVLSRLAAQCGVVFFQLEIWGALIGGAIFCTSPISLLPPTIQDTII